MQTSTSHFGHCIRVTVSVLPAALYCNCHRLFVLAALTWRCPTGPRPANERLVQFSQVSRTLHGFGRLQANWPARRSRNILSIGFNHEICGVLLSPAC